MAVALLAVRSNPDMAIGTVMAGQAAGIQQQLNYSRDFEREADRLGLDLMDQAGFDTRGMASFFERMLQFGRLYDNNAPGYLRTHPLTTERMADMQNRIALHVPRQAAGRVDFRLIRAKVRATDGAPADAVAQFAAQLKDGHADDEVENRFGHAHALLRANRLTAAEAELAALRRLGVQSAMMETLAARLRIQRNDPVGAVQLLTQAMQTHPQNRSVALLLIETRLTAGPAANAAGALDLVEAELVSSPRDPRLLGLKAKAYAQLGKRMLQHHAQAEAYLNEGRLDAAIMQLNLARQADDGDFFEQSKVDARLRELRQRKREEMSSPQ
jgi:predicted Zn-dependent protease